MRIAVRGGGMYGCVAAEMLQESGYDVTLVETAPDILLGASSRNFRRLHRGFHYPLSQDTALECLKAHKQFIKRYDAFCCPCHTTYWIADDSTVNPDFYVDFCRKLDNWLIISRPDSAVRNVTIGVGVRESTYDVDMFRGHFKKKLKITSEEPEHDVLVDCTYINSPLANKWSSRESTILHLAGPLAETAQTVLYGPYCGYIPMKGGGFRFYHAKYTSPAEMMEDGARYFPAIKRCTIRSVIRQKHVRPPNDRRPYWINVDGNQINVLGGKIAQAVPCGIEIVKRVENIAPVSNAGKARAGREAEKVG